MTKFTDHLWRDLVAEHGATLADVDRSEPGRAPFLRRPGVLAGGTLVLAALGTGIALLVGSLIGTSAYVPTAYGITTYDNGTVLVTIDHNSALPDANAKLAAMGIHEVIEISMAAGPAPVSGPVTCTLAPGVSHLPGPPVQVLVGANGTEIIAPGTTGDNTGVGTWHLAACQLRSDAHLDYSGNSGGG